MKKKYIFIILLTTFIICFLIIFIIIINRFNKETIKAEAQLELYSNVIKYQYNNNFPVKLDLIIHDSFLDPWGEKVIYERNKEGNGFYLKTLGKDKKEGGSFNNKDIVLAYNMKINKYKGCKIFYLEN